MSETGKILNEANEKINAVRISVLLELVRLLPKGKIHSFSTSRLCVTDEEEGVRLEVSSVNKDEITLEDNSTMCLADLGTDDLISVLDTLDAELNHK